MHRNMKMTPARKTNRHVLFSVAGVGGLPSISIFVPLGYKIAQLPELTHIFSPPIDLTIASAHLTVFEKAPIFLELFGQS